MSMSAAEYRAQAKRPKRHKYNATAVTVDGIRFASKREAAYYGTLKMREKAGEVSAVELQKPYTFTSPDGTLLATYRADFCFWDHTADRFRVVDVKGVETAEFRMKKRMMRAFYGIEVEVVK